MALGKVVLLEVVRNCHIRGRLELHHLNRPQLITRHVVGYASSTLRVVALLHLLQLDHHTHLLHQWDQASAEALQRRALADVSPTLHDHVFLEA
jgi:hypothetical protein